MEKQMTQQMDANQVLMGGGGPAAWKFTDPNPGAPRVGTITSPPVARQEREYNKMNPSQPGDPKVFPSGDPIMGIHVEVQTSERDPYSPDDDGRRTFYIEGRYLKEAVRGAIQKAGAPGLEVGGQLAVTFTHREDPMDKQSRKFWDISYTPAGNATLMGDPQQQYAPPAQQPQQPPQGQPWGQQPPQQQPPQQQPWGQQPPQGQQPPTWAPQPAQQQQPQQQQPPAQQQQVQQPPAQQPATPAPAGMQNVTPEQLAAFQQYQASQQQGS